MVRAAMRPLAFLEHTNVEAGPKSPLFLLSVSVSRWGDRLRRNPGIRKAQPLLDRIGAYRFHAGRQQNLAEHPIMVQSWSDPSRRALREE